MADALQRALGDSVTRLLRPLVRMLIRTGVPFAAFVEQAKRAYIDVAASEFQLQGRKPSISRTAVITGLTRKEVSRIWNESSPDDGAADRKYNRATRVIRGWVTDARFNDGDNQPAPLSIATGSVSFSELVRLHAGDVPARAVLDELLRVGAIAERLDGRVELVTRAYVPAAGEQEKLEILGADVAELISTIDHNISQPAADARFQRKVSYDNLPLESLPELRRTAAESGQALLEELDRAMAAHDRDAAPAGRGTGRARASVGIYYFEEELVNAEDEKPAPDSEAGESPSNRSRWSS